MAKKKKSTTFRVDGLTTRAEDGEWIKQTGGLSEEAAQEWIANRVKFDVSCNESDYRIVGE
jgi:hypothetical protein|tara:strand:+ start:523 stop:705 length:183 start_codon:yes stop_codon:yes gene_type:complete